MRVSVILGHPTPRSFNHAIADAALSALHANRHEPLFHDLYREGFDPVMPSAEIPKDAALPPEIDRHCREIGEADGIIIIHPNWWSAPPAILRGWCDRVLRPGRAYAFVPDGRGGAKPQGLLKAGAALVFTTANTPLDQERARFGDPLETHWLKVVFGLCGVPRTERVDFSPVIVSTANQRAGWLRDAAAAVGRMFPAAGAPRPGACVS